MSLNFETNLNKAQTDPDRKIIDSKIIKLSQLLAKNNLESRESVCVFPKQRRVKVFRSDDFLKITEQCLPQIDEIFKEYSQELTKKKKFSEFTDLQIQKGILLRLDRVPKKSSSEKTLKWPKELQASRNQVWENKVFYAWTIEKPQGKTFGFLMVSLLLVVCLFPIWPYKAKLYLFYTCLYLQIFLIGFILVRQQLYMVLRIVGIEFWILPEIFENDAQFPLISYGFNFLEEGISGWLWRISIIACFGYFYYIGTTKPEALVEYQTFASEGINDIFEWGRQKLSNEGGPKFKSDSQRIQDDIQNNNDDDEDENEQEKKEEETKIEQKNQEKTEKDSASDDDVELNYGDDNKNE